MLFEGSDISFDIGTDSAHYDIRDADWTINIGESYDVIYNGVEYNNLVAYDDGGYATIGAPWLEFTEEMPFLVVDDEGILSVCTEIEMAEALNKKFSISISRVDREIKTIDPKFIPASTQIFFYAKRDNSGTLVTNFLYKDERFEDEATPAEVSAALSTGNVYINDPRSSRRWLRPVYVSNEYSNETNYYIEMGCVYEFEADGAVDAIVFSMSASDK